MVIVQCAMSVLVKNCWWRCKDSQMCEIGALAREVRNRTLKFTWGNVPARICCLPNTYMPSILIDCLPDMIKSVWKSGTCRFSIPAGLFFAKSLPAVHLQSHCFRREAEINMSLLDKKCVPCSGKELHPMTVESARTLLQQIPGWNLSEVEGLLRLHRGWKTKNFQKGVEYLKRIADVAESEGHHPDLHLVKWNNVNVDIWTHSIGGLSENDFILAAKISAMEVGDLVKKAVSKAPTEP